MKRIFVGFTLLLSFFLSPLVGIDEGHIGILAGLNAKPNLMPGILELIIAALITAIFLKVFNIRNRIYFPMPGFHLMNFASFFYILSFILSGIAIAYLANQLGITDTNQSALPLLLLFLISASNIFVYVIWINQAILLIGVFKVLANLLPSPSE